MKPFDYFEPDTLDEALDLLYHYGARAKILAGGTDLVVQMKGGKLKPEILIGLKRVKELDFVERNETLRLGPMTLLRTVATHPLIEGPLSILREAALAVGDRQIRNMATIGGNLANGSPSADTAAAFLALDANVTIRKKGCERMIRVEDFFVQPFLTCLEPEELIVEISFFPIPEGRGTYLWMPKRAAVDETLVGLGACLTIDGDEHILKVALAANSVGPIPVRLRRAEAFLEGKILREEHFQKAGEIAAQEVSPRSRSEYRRKIVSVLVSTALKKLSRRGGE